MTALSPITLRLVFLYLLVNLTLASGYGQRVSFDSSFGLNARAYTQIGNPQGFSSVYKFTSLRPDGSFFLAGDYNQPDTNFFITKFKSNGSHDSSYGVNGKLFVKRADFGVTSILASGLDSSARFVFIGRTSSPNGPFYYRLRVIRYTALPKIDSSFGINGIADIPFDNIVSSGINYFITAYRDGRLLVTAYMGENTVISNALFRLKINGTLDSSFASNGKLFLPPSSGLTNFYSVNLQPDEKIVFARQFNASLFLFRYNTNGTIDNSFNQTGSMNVDYPAGNNGFDGIRILSNNKILLAAGTGAGHYLYRFKANGQRDSTFGPSGFVPYNYGFKTYARDFAEQPDGKILAAGVIQDNLPIPNINSLITRSNPDGSIDSTFDDDGVWFFYYGGNPASGMKHLHLLSTAKMLFSGLESGSDWTHFVAYRLKEAYQTSVISVSWGTASGTIINSDCSSGVSINWTTLSENSISHFRLEYSTNNIVFNQLAQVTAIGAPTTPANYQYLHVIPQNGNNYYKIIAVAANGQEFVWGVLTVNIPPNSTNLFQWLSHELVNTPGDCRPSIKLLFRTTRPVISDSIIIEHSTDSLNFIMIAKIPVANPQSSIYQYIDTRPQFGKNYYRLRTNGPGSVCISDMYSVVLWDAKGIIAFPVPVNDRVFFNQTLSTGSVLTLFDIKGRLVLKKELTAPANDLQLSHLASGVYILKIYTLCTERILRLVKITK